VTASHTQLVIVVDGLRPDYVTPEVMPRPVAAGTARHRLSRAPFRVSDGHARERRVVRHGSYPETHGLMGNVLYSPNADPIKGLDTGERANLESVERAEGRLLTAPTLSEIFAPAEKTLLAVGSGSTGSAYLLNHTLATGAIIHYDYVRPAALEKRVAAALGPPPPHATPNDAQNQYAIDAYLKVGLDDVHPDVTFMWLNDPDGTAHANGIGSELTAKSLALVDAGIGRIEDTLRARGILDRVNIIVTSDHGFSTHTRELRLSALIEPFEKPMPDGTKDIVVAEGAIYLRSGADPARISAIVAALQARPEVGAIFTRPRAPGNAEGSVPGTLSFDIARWNHPRSGDILVSSNWNREGTMPASPARRPMATSPGTARVMRHSQHAHRRRSDFLEHAVSDVPTATSISRPRCCICSASACRHDRPIISEGLAGNVERSRHRRSDRRDGPTPMAGTSSPRTSRVAGTPILITPT
jgi:hypothetical protein